MRLKLAAIAATALAAAGLGTPLIGQVGQPQQATPSSAAAKPAAGQQPAAAAQSQVRPTAQQNLPAAAAKPAAPAKDAAQAKTGAAGPGKDVAPKSAAAKGGKTPVRKAAPAAAAAGPAVAAKTIFGALGTPAPMAARAIGFYAKGCLSGAKPLAIDGPTWQAMRLSRNRNWGHPDLIKLIERLAQDAKAHDGWPGLLVGDISQPRGGPMLTGHNSHQIGLDADIWLTPMPDRRLSAQEREELSATSMLAPDGVYADPKVWTVNHARLILRAASYPEVERVLVHPGIKLALCQQPGADPDALAKVRPFWGHHYHMHIRIACPKGSEGCQPQQPPVNLSEPGCGKEIDDWIVRLRRPPQPEEPGAKPAPAKPSLTLDQLPAECRMVVNAGAPSSSPAPPALSAPPKGAAGADLRATGR